MNKARENQKLKKWETITITANISNTPQTTNNKSKITGKRIAIKNRNFKKMDNFIKNQKNNITKMWDNKYGIKTRMRKFKIWNSKIKTRHRPAFKELSKIKCKEGMNYRIKISQNISKIWMIKNLFLQFLNHSI